MNASIKKTFLLKNIFLYFLIVTLTISQPDLKLFACKNHKDYKDVYCLSFSTNNKNMLNNTWSTIRKRKTNNKKMFLKSPKPKT